MSMELPRDRQANRLTRAMELARVAHLHQIDKGGERYLWHVLRVGVSLLPDIDAAVVGILHDVLEDHPYLIDQLGEALDHEPSLALDMDALTRRDGERYDDYIRRAAQRPLSRRVKIADLRDNLNGRRLARAAKVVGTSKVDMLQRRYTSALQFLLEPK